MGGAVFSILASTGVRLSDSAEMGRMMGVTLVLFSCWLDILVRAINFTLVVKRLYLNFMGAC
jgi:hypothetical protein